LLPDTRGFALRLASAARATAALRLAVPFALAGLLAAHPAGAQCTTSWVAAVSGNWSDQLKWDNGAPDAADYACITVAGTYTVTLNVSTTVGSLTLGGATGTQTLLISGNALTMLTNSTVSVQGVLDWRGGLLSTGAGASLTSAGTLLMSTAADKVLNAGTLVNTGTATWTAGTFWVQNVSTFENRGLLDVQADVTMNTFSSGPNIFRNTATGTHRKSGGLGEHVLASGANGIKFENAGAVDAQTGTIRIAGNSTQDGATFAASAGAAIHFDAGTHTFAGMISGSPAGRVFLDSPAVLQADPAGATLNFSGTGFEWSSASIQGGSGGGGAFTNAGILRMTTAGTKLLDGATTLTNTGTVEWTAGSFFIENGSTFENQALFDVQADVLMSPFFTSATFRNAATGTYRKSGGAGEHLIDNGLLFENFGALDAQTGTIRIAGNSTQADATLATSSGAVIQFSAGTHTFAGTLSGSPAGRVFVDLGAAFQADPAGATLNFSGTGFEWRGGNLVGDDPFTNAGLLRLTPGANKVIDGATELINTGTVRLTGSVIIEDGSTVENRGLFDIQDNLGLSSSGTGPNRFVNAAGGTLRKSAGTGTSAVGVETTNQSGAVIDAAVGTLDFTGTLNHQAGALVQGNGILDVPSGTSLTNAGTTGPGASPGLLTWAGNFNPTATAALEVELGGTTAGSGHDQLAVTGSAALGGTLRLRQTVGFFPQVGQTFTVLTASNVTGAFATVQPPTGYGVTVTVNPTNVVVAITSVPSFDLVAANLTALTVQAGGSIQFRAAIRNNTANAVSGQLFFTATGGSQGVIQSATVGANASVGPFVFTQSIPGTTPPGTYSYVLRIGQFPNTTVDQVPFTIVVTAAERVADEPVAEGVAEEAQVPGEAASEAAVAASAGADLPAEYVLHAAYPNPFQDRATLRYELPEAASVRIVVYDLLGREVAVIVDGELGAGRHAAVLDGRALAAGVYVVRMTAGERALTQRLTLAR
jgi:hypothetical protein